MITNISDSGSISLTRRHWKQNKPRIKKENREYFSDKYKNTNWFITK